MEKIADDYAELLENLRRRTDGIDHATSNLANAAAILFNGMEQINWAGFYLMENGKLILGPFQGKPAVVEIEVGKGVCGTAVQENKLQRVEDVHCFCGHIACDCASNSEIVIPIYKDGGIYGVLDMDSPVLGRFTEEDEKYLSEFVKLLEQRI